MAKVSDPVIGKNAAMLRAAQEAVRSRRMPPGQVIIMSPNSLKRMEIRDDDYVYLANDASDAIRYGLMDSRFGSRVDDLAPSPTPQCLRCGVAIQAEGICDPCRGIYEQQARGATPATIADLDALMKSVYVAPMLMAKRPAQRAPTPPPEKPAFVEKPRKRRIDLSE